MRVYEVDNQTPLSTLSTSSFEGFKQPQKDGEPDEALDEKKQKSGYANFAQPILPVLFFHVQ